MKNTFNICTISLLVLFQNTVTADQIFRWVDKDGRVHYGDTADKPELAEDISEQINDQNVYKSELGETPADLLKRGRNVSKYMERNEHSTPLPITVYSLQEPLLPKARLLNMLSRRGSLWFASDVGLIEFNPVSERWFLYNESTGLPGDTVRDLTLDKGRMFLKIMNWTGRNSLDTAGNYWFDVEENRFQKSRKTINQVRAGGSFTPKNSDALSHNIAHVMHYQGKIWLTSYEFKPSKTSKGGVVALKPLTKSGRQFTTRDGLAHSYCYDITASENNSVWVTHWEEERGLSVLYNHAQRWKNIIKSRNGIELGGVRIAAVDHYILIGQQRALVIYDRKSELAFSLDESYGLPGYIVSDIMVDEQNIWVSAYGYSGSGSDRGGLVKIARHDIDGLFERMLKEEESEIIPLTNFQALPPKILESKIISHEIAYDGQDRLGIDVTYYYSGDKGDNAWLSGITLNNGVSTGYWTHYPLHMKNGENTGRITIGLNDKVAPDNHCTNGILFEMYARNISTFHSTEVNYDKCWDKKQITEQ